MKSSIIDIFLFLSVVSSSAQTVSDFSGTDLEGTTHKLFEYLDAGKYVVIKFTQTQ